MSIDLASYKPLYLKTAKEYVADMKSACADLKKNGADAASIEKIYIAAHSLKSQSLIMEYKETGAVCSVLETKFRILKESEATVSGNLLDLSVEAAGFIGQQLSKIEVSEPEISSLEICRKLESAEAKKQP